MTDSIIYRVDILEMKLESIIKILRGFETRIDDLEKELTPTETT